MKRELSQQEIDIVFQKTGSSARSTKVPEQPFDFTRLDRIPKSQIRSVHMLHENFCRNLAPSLSAYLRDFVSMNLVSLEQISYSEFLEGLASPTFIAYVGLKPYDGMAVMELNPALVFTFVEMLLGGKGQTSMNAQRKVTEIEKNLMQNLLRIVLQDLREAWKTVTDIQFSVQSLASEPQVLPVLALAEAVVAIGIEAHVGATTSLINLAFPSIFVKRLRHLFERLRRIHRQEPRRRDQIHMADLLMDADLDLEARLEGTSISTHGLLDLEPGDVLALDFPVDRAVTGFLNGEPKFQGFISPTRNKLAYRIDKKLRPEVLSHDPRLP
jgi:flagellar motor switch protein FliM